MELTTKDIGNIARAILKAKSIKWVSDDKKSCYTEFGWINDVEKILKEDFNKSYSIEDIEEVAISMMSNNKKKKKTIAN